MVLHDKRPNEPIELMADATSKPVEAAPAESTPAPGATSSSTSAAAMETDA